MTLMKVVSPQPGECTGLAQSLSTRVIKKAYPVNIVTKNDIDLQSGDCGFLQMKEVLDKMQ